MRLIDADALKTAVDGEWCPDMMVSEIWDVIDHAPTIGGWISVKDRLPESKPDDLEYQTVIIALGDGTVELGCYYESTKEWGAGENFDRLRKPVAWMPLPEPPEEVTEHDQDDF